MQFCKSANLLYTTVWRQLRSYCPADDRLIKINNYGFPSKGNIYQLCCEIGRAAWIPIARYNIIKYSAATRTIFAFGQSLRSLSICNQSVTIKRSSSKIQNGRVPRTLSAYISNKQLLPFFSRFFKRGNKICVTRDTKLDAKRAAASATLAERFMKREEREIVRPSSFALAFSGLDVKTRKRRAFLPARICHEMHVLPFLNYAERISRKKQKPRAVDEYPK